VALGLREVRCSGTGQREGARTLVVVSTKIA